MKVKIGSRWSIHRTSLFCATGEAIRRSPSADADLVVAGEGVGRHGEVLRRGTLADAARGVVDRAVARAEPAAILAAIVVGALAQRDAAQMRADADDD